MPTGSEASEQARREARHWVELAGDWRPEDHAAVWADLPPSEAAVLRFSDPSGDLERRAVAWGYRLPGGDLGDLARFAAGLALAEAEAWADDRPHVAARALEDRRFLLSDRILHWAVPWLDTAGRCYPGEREAAHGARDRLLAAGERLRCAPLLTGREGTTVPGEDSYGPIEIGVPPGERLLSLWSGAVIMKATLASMRGAPDVPRVIEAEWLDDPALRRDLATLYEVAAGRWSRLAAQWEGTARLWSDLAERAEATAVALG